MARQTLDTNLFHYSNVWLGNKNENSHMKGINDSGEKRREEKGLNFILHRTAKKSAAMKNFSPGNRGMAGSLFYNNNNANLI
jgi:hypothetical protein